MSSVRIELNSDGVRALLRSGEMMAECEKRANEAVGRVGAGYTVSTHTGKNRVNASIEAETYEAKRDNMENNTILKALR